MGVPQGLVATGLAVGLCMVGMQLLCIQLMLIIPYVLHSDETCAMVQFALVSDETRRPRSAMHAQINASEFL